MQYIIFTWQVNNLLWFRFFLSGSIREYEFKKNLDTWRLRLTTILQAHNGANVLQIQTTKNKFLFLKITTQSKFFLSCVGGDGSNLDF